MGPDVFFPHLQIPGRMKYLFSSPELFHLPPSFDRKLFDGTNHREGPLPRFPPPLHLVDFRNLTCRCAPFQFFEVRYNFSICKPDISVRMANYCSVFLSAGVLFCFLITLNSLFSFSQLERGGITESSLCLSIDLPQCTPHVSLLDGFPLRAVAITPEAYFSPPPFFSTPTKGDTFRHIGTL